MGSLTLSCPACGHEHEDAWEVLDVNQASSMRCDRCRVQFWFALMECHRCENEQSFTWRHEPSPKGVAMLECEACHGTFRCPDAQAEEELA